MAYPLFFIARLFPQQWPLPPLSPGCFPAPCIMQKKKTILVSWIGMTDVASITNADASLRGPLYAILEHFCGKARGFFQKIILLHNRQLQGHAALPHIEQTAAHFGCREVDFHLLDVDAVDMAALYQAELRLLAGLPDNVTLYYSLTSGTGAMHSVQLLMSTKFPGVPVYTVRPEFRLPHEPGVRIVPLPDILSGMESESPPSNGLFIAEANKKIFDQVRTKIARTRASVLIMGETGAGKSQLAQYIHARSDRAGKNMVSLNCAEVAGDHNMMRSELFGHKKNSFTGAREDKTGAFEEADGGSLFLDEVGEIPLALQPLLLKALDEGIIMPLGASRGKKVDVRIIAATNRDLLRDVQEGRFRRDLYYRLAQYMPRLSPVAGYSREDRSRLLGFLLDEINREWFAAAPRALSPDAKDLLLSYAWPGNIREMKFRLTTICLLADRVIYAADVAEQLEMQQEPGGNDDALPSDINAWLDSRHASFIKKALDRCGGSVSEAARLLGLPQSTFVSRKKKFGL